ncbi:MAG TPA: hypothetical protein VI386_35385 [Candidatus Sulfotelmatobacter sp.]
MRSFYSWLLIFLLTSVLVSITPGRAAAVAKPHVVSFGRWTPVPCPSAPDESIQTLRVRALIVDGKVKEYTFDTPHEVTERLFVARRAFRINDSLPTESASPRWLWQRGGWLLVDRMTGKVSSINLPDFDASSSIASWYRDYVAYCGVSDDGQKRYAVVAQLNRKKPVLKKALADSGTGAADPGSACSPAAWQRRPVEVSFGTAGGPKQTFAVRGHTVDVVVENEDEDAAEASK